MLRVGDICPLFFNAQKDKFAQSIDYLQRFHSSDTILLQVFSDSGESVTGTLNNLLTGAKTSIPFSTYNHNDSVKMMYASFKGLSDSVYTITLNLPNTTTCEPFEVCSSDYLLEATSLIRYSNKDNNSSYDNIFWINNTQQIFEFRVEAGFKPSGVKFAVDNEQFRNQFQEPQQLYSVAYETHEFTIGAASGVPIWFGRLINRIFDLSEIYVDGIKYVRSESSVPELSNILEDMQTFNFKMTLQQASSNIGGIGGKQELPSGSSVPNFMMDGVEDGSMFVYSGEDSAIKPTKVI